MILRPLAEGLRSRRSAQLGVLVCATIIIVSFLSVVNGYDPVADVDPSRAGRAASAAHWLGTDPLGRDVASRLAAGGIAFIAPGSIAGLVALIAGLPAGAFAGWYGGHVAATLRFGFGVLSAVPGFVLVLLACSIFGNHLGVIAVALGLSYAPTLGEEVYSRVTAMRISEYVLASRAYGLPDWRILWVHLIAVGCGRTIARHLVLLFGYTLALETSLSYIGGFGVQEPAASWGNMIAFAWGRSGDGWSFAAPIALVWLTTAALAWVADGLVEGDVD